MIALIISPVGPAVVARVTASLQACANVAHRGGHVHGTNFAPADRAISQQLTHAAILANSLLRDPPVRYGVLAFLGAPFWLSATCAASAPFTPHRWPRIVVLVLVAVGLLGCVAALPIVRLVLRPYSPAQPLLFWSSFVVLVLGVVASSALAVHPRWLMMCVVGTSRPGARCFNLDVEGFAGRPIRDHSAGVACFWACLRARMDEFVRLGESWRVPPFGREGVDVDALSAPSAGVDQDGKWLPIGGAWAAKLPTVAVMRLDRVFCAAADAERHIAPLHEADGHGALTFRWHPSGSRVARSGWGLPRSSTWDRIFRRSRPRGFDVVACSDIYQLLRYLDRSAPWRAGVRVGLVVLPLALRALSSEPLPPEFVIVHSLRCAERGGIRSCVLGAGERDQVTVELHSTGYGDDVELLVESNVNATLQLGDEPRQRKLPTRRVKVGQSTFRVFMPADEAGTVAVSVVARNRAGRESGESVQYERRE